MSAGIGVYPGGPHGSAPVQEPQRHPRLMRVEELEEHVARRYSRLRQRKRRKYVILALVLGIPMAGGLGFAIVHSAHKTADELTEALEAEARPDPGISKEVDRALLELWRMEEVEYTRNRRGR